MTYLLRFFDKIIILPFLLLMLSGCASFAPGQPLRVASFNVSMEARNYRAGANAPVQPKALQRALEAGDHPQIRNIAEILQRARPDIVLLNEFDANADPELFIRKYLGVSQNGAEPFHYAYFYQGASNTGRLSPVDHNRDGKMSLPYDGWGYGDFPGHYGMLLLSRYPIDTANVREFRHFLWRDLPGALTPQYPDGEAFYPPEAWAQLRLSSKSHWDVPVQVGRHQLHILASHPVPPVFDGEEDRNGRRNHDEIRFWSEYLNNADFIADDQGQSGGLHKNTRFVLVGDLNASPVEGDARPEAIRDLIAHPRMAECPLPTSLGGKVSRPENPNASSHTASWGLRADYVLPSSGMRCIQSEVFWPAPNSPMGYLVESRALGSDHRLVWVDLLLR